MYRFLSRSTFVWLHSIVLLALAACQPTPAGGRVRLAVSTPPGSVMMVTTQVRCGT
jgi:hypothetical protein